MEKIVAAVFAGFGMAFPFTAAGQGEQAHNDLPQQLAAGAGQGGLAVVWLSRSPPLFRQHVRDERAGFYDHCRVAVAQGRTRDALRRLNRSAPEDEPEGVQVAQAGKPAPL